MTVLITGASGFVGAHCVRRLATDASVIAADVTPPDHAVRAFWSGSGRRVTFEALDVADAAAVRRLVERARPRHVVHAAALTPTPEEERTHCARIVAVNIGGTANVIDAVVATGGVARLVLFSSAAVYGYGPGTRDPLGEATPPAPFALYGMTKVAAEAIARRMAALTGLSIVAIRVAAAYGRMERPTATRRRMSPLHRLAAACAAGGPVRVAGPDLPRDFVHADDVAGAVAVLLRAERLGHDVYNVSAGAIGWRTLVERFRARGLVARWIDDAGAADIATEATDVRPTLDATRLAADTGFHPAIGLEAGIDDLLAGARP